MKRTIPIGRRGHTPVANCQEESNWVQGKKLWRRQKISNLHRRIDLIKEILIRDYRCLDIAIKTGITEKVTSHHTSRQNRLRAFRCCLRSNALKDMTHRNARWRLTQTAGNHPCPPMLGSFRAGILRWTQAFCSSRSAYSPPGGQPWCHRTQQRRESVRDHR